MPFNAATAVRHPSLQRVVDLVAAPTIGAALGAASFARRARIFHPSGAAFQGTIDLDPGADAVGACSLAGAGRHKGVIRLSRGVGLPERMPDILGLAIRILDAHGPDRPQDLLLVSSAAPALGRHAILPATGFGSGFYSSILPYHCDGELVLFGARVIWPAGTEPAGAATRRFDDLEREIEGGRLRFELMVATLTGPWQPIGRIDGGRRLGDAEQESLRFNVFNTGEALQPAGLFNALRRTAYRASQAARPTPLADPTDHHDAA